MADLATGVATTVVVVVLERLLEVTCDALLLRVFTSESSDARDAEEIGPGAV